MNDDTSTRDEQHVHHHGEGHLSGRRPRLTGWILTMVTALVVVAVGFVGVALGHSKYGATSTITVTGSGTVQGTPDTINFQIGVSTVNPTATAALTDNDNKVRALEAALLKNGVTRKEMQTSGLNIYDNTNNQGVVTGFTVDDTLNVTMHKVQRAGVAIDAAARAVGNGVQLNGVSFTITNDSSLLRAARIRAARNRDESLVMVKDTPFSCTPLPTARAAASIATPARCTLCIVTFNVSSTVKPVTTP